MSTVNKLSNSLISNHSRTMQTDSAGTLCFFNSYPSSKAPSKYESFNIKKVAKALSCISNIPKRFEYKIIHNKVKKVENEILRYAQNDK